MINETYKAMLGGKSVIRTLSEYATARGAEIGYDNVFDYSLGNPSVPCPSSFTKAMIDMYETADPVALHGYSPSLGNPEACRTIAESLNRRFGMDYTAGHIFPTTVPPVRSPTRCGPSPSPATKCSRSRHTSPNTIRMSKARARG